MLWNNPFAKADKGNAAPAQQQNNNAPQNGQQPNQNTNPNNSNFSSNQSSGVIPNKDGTTNNGGQGDQGDDPMAKFAELWQPDKDKDGNPITPQNNQPTSYLPPVDPQKFAGILEKMDFTKNITPEDRTALAAGGEGATQAMMNILNKTHRHSFATMFQAMTRMVEGGFANAQDRFSQNVPDVVRDYMTDDSLMSSNNSLMKNPAFEPMVKSVKAQYLKKFPKATPSEVNTAVNQYFDFMAGELTKSKEKQNAAAKPTNQDKLRQGSQDADFMSWIEAEVGGTQNQNQDQNQNI